jgi:hypothetical protein
MFFYGLRQTKIELIPAESKTHSIALYDALKSTESVNLVH